MSSPGSPLPAPTVDASPPPQKSQVPPPAVSPPPPLPLLSPPVASSPPPPLQLTPIASSPPPPLLSPPPVGSSAPPVALQPPPPPPLAFGPPPVSPSPPFIPSPALPLLPPPILSPPPSPPLPVPPPPSFAPSPPGELPPPLSPPLLSPPSPAAILSPPPPAVLSPPVTGNSSNNSASATSSPVPEPPVSPNNSTGSPSHGGINTTSTVAVGVILAVLVFSCAIGIVWFRRRQKKKVSQYYPGFTEPSAHASQPVSGFMQYNNTQGPMSGDAMNYSMGSQGQNCSTGSQGLSYGSAGHLPGSTMSDLSVGSTKAFSYEELHSITGGFAKQNVLGEGGFGCVYKGVLLDGRVVAVKQLKGGGGQGEREFKAEVEIISRVHHRHLVSLVGYCIADNQRLLVYDYVSNNTLHYHLHAKVRPCLDWPTRVKIAAGSARGLAYLHEACHPRIIHRDIKTSNILLDDNFEAQVADFGLAKLAESDVTHVSTRVMGTFGYLAPEYASTGKLTDKSDVFSFGVVLLELITGRKPIDSARPLGDESLVEWARPLLNHAIETQRFDDIVDPRLQGNYSEPEMFSMIEVAASCIRHSAARRPKMGQVVRALDSLSNIDISNGVQPGKSELFDVANTADIRQFQRMAFGSQDYSSADFSHGSLDSGRNF